MLHYVVIEGYMWSGFSQVVWFLTTHSEHKSLLAPEYGLSNDILDLTGFPRFDHLFYLNEHSTLTDKEKGLPTHKIFFMPTWRKSLQMVNPLNNNRATHSDAFLHSQYYKKGIYLMYSLKHFKEDAYY